MTEEEMLAERREKRVAYQRAWRAANPDKVAASKRKYNYGITQDKYEEMLSMQNSSCAICANIDPGCHGVFSVDHCHTTGVVRGLLCHSCNVGLGYFRDSKASLQNAIEYLTAAERLH